MTRPYRSVLYIPGSNARALDKARDLAVDAIIFDLEDAVAPAEKESARDLLATALLADYGGRARILRINGLDSEWGDADARALGQSADAVLLPKVNRPEDLDRLARILPQTPLWAMMETAEGVLNAAAIAAHPRLQGLVMGTNDLARELNCRDRPDRLPLQPALGLCLLAARAHGKVIVDGVFTAFRDEGGLEAECEQGRDMGFDGKSLIHPAQIEAANRIFAPSDSDIDLAHRQIAAHEQAIAQGQGVAVLDGRIVENLHVDIARKTLARAETIARMGQL